MTNLASKIKKKNKLSYILITSLLISVGLVLLLAVTIISISLNSFYERQKNYVEDKLLNQFASNIKPLMERYDYYGIEKSCQQFLTEEIVKYVYVFDNSGFIINQLYSEKINYFTAFIDNVTTPILNSENEKIGEIKVGFDYRAYYYSLFRVKIIIFIAIMLIIALFSFIIISVINNKLTYPLEQLLYSINKISSGEYNYKLQIKSDDELGEISNAFNDMTSKLNSTISLIDGIVKNLPSALIFIDQKFKVNLWNKMAIEMFNIDFDQAIYKSIFEVDQYFVSLEDDILSVLNKPEKKTIKNKLINSERFKEKYHTISLIPLFSKDFGRELKKESVKEYKDKNELQGIIIKIDDETENIKNLEIINQIQMIESIQTLGSGIAHDLNNILGSITGVIALLDVDSKESKNIDKKDLTDYIEILRLSTQKATLVVNQILSLSKKKDIQFAEVNLIKCINEVIKISQHSFDKSVEIIFNPKIEDAYVYGSGSQIEQVFLNLFINSYHAMTIMKKPGEKRGGNLTISISEVERDDSKYWGISIKDQGVGIPKENIKKIFDPFFSTKTNSSGLGLAMVYNIIQNHSGIIEVESIVGEGTEFKIYLPYYKSEKIDRENYEVEIRGNYYGKNAIVIDDDDILRKVVLNLLKKLGFNVFEVAKPEKTFEIYEQIKDKVDLIVLDLIMPKLSGAELYNILIQKYKISEKGIPVILTTGLILDERIIELKKNENIHILSKPYTLEDILKILETIYLEK